MLGNPLEFEYLPSIFSAQLVSPGLGGCLGGAGGATLRTSLPRIQYLAPSGSWMLYWFWCIARS